jgi:Mitochondrial domain of unknown function (DUF1713)
MQEVRTHAVWMSLNDYITFQALSLNIYKILHSAVVPFLKVAANTRAGQPAVQAQDQHLMALELRLMQHNREADRLLSPFSSILLPSSYCEMLPEHTEPGSIIEDGAENANQWQADSVRRKRKKKMNKHKHSKRRKLTRHKR